MIAGLDEDRVKASATQAAGRAGQAREHAAPAQPRRVGNAGAPIMPVKTHMPTLGGRGHGECSLVYTEMAERT